MHPHKNQSGSQQQNSEPIQNSSRNVFIEQDSSINNILNSNPTVSNDHPQISEEEYQNYFPGFQSHSNSVNQGHNQSTLSSQSDFKMPTDSLLQHNNSLQSQTTSQNEDFSHSGHSATAHKYENQIKALLPQIHEHLLLEARKEHIQKFNQQISQYRKQMTLQYQQKVEMQIDIMKENVNSNVENKYLEVNEIKKQISLLKKQNKSRKSLTEEEKTHLVEKTVQEIFTSKRLMAEVKEKLQPQVQQRVHFILSRDLENQLLKCQSEIEEKITDEREEFKAQKKQHWKQRSEKELHALAEQYECLKLKKQQMLDILMEKNQQKKKAYHKMQKALENATRIRQLNLQIKEYETKLFKKTTISRRAHLDSKSRQKSVGKWAKPQNNQNESLGSFLRR